MRIAIDIDSTLHDYWPRLAGAARRRFGIDLPYAEQYDWGITRLKPEQLQCCIEETHTESAILGAQPYPGAVETVARWHAAGHFIHVTSHRSEDRHGPTARWLEQIGLPHDELYCSMDKVSRCAELDIDVLIDDSPVNLLRAIECGITPATILHPWNEDVVEEEGVVHGADWPSLAESLEQVLDRLRGRVA